MLIQIGNIITNYQR